MQNSKLLTPKRQHYNRFAYLLQPTVEHQIPKPQKQFNFFSINLCSQNPCKAKEIELQVKEKATTSRLEQHTRKPLKYELHSQNYKLFKQQIEHKSSFNSFLAYTPQKSEIKDQFSIYNEISTIEYTKSNQMHTHRNLFESILEEETKNFPTYPTEQDDSRDEHVWKLLNLNEEAILPIAWTKPMQNQHIKLELSQSDDDDDPRKSDPTEGGYYQKDKNTSTAQKSTRFMQFIRKSQLQSIEVSEPSKNDSIEYSSVQQVLNHKDNKWSKLTIATLKTKNMSQKLQESSQLEYQNSISVTSKHSQSPSVFGSHKTIRLGRRTLNKN